MMRSLAFDRHGCVADVSRFEGQECVAARARSPCLLFLDFIRLMLHIFLCYTCIYNVFIYL